MPERLDLHAVDPVDEGHHDPEPGALWNESWYFDFHAQDGAIGGWVRLGLYPNFRRGGGVAWYTAVVVGAGRPTVVVVDFEAPLPARDSGAVETAEVRADHRCEAPLERWRVTAEAAGVRLARPADAYRVPLPGERVDVGFDLTWDSSGMPFHYGFTTRYEIPCRVAGRVQIDGEDIAIDGAGQRDHSWAVRDWWRVGWLWTAGRLDDGTSFHASHIRLPGSPVSFGYVQWPEHGLEVVTSADVDDEIDGEALPVHARIVFEPSGLDVEVEPLAHAPVLLRSDDGRTSYFPRALCRFTARDGRRGFGWTEWNLLDRS